MHWYLKVIKNYVGFSGRASRTEFWMFCLVNMIIGLVLGAGMLATADYSSTSDINGFFFYYTNGGIFGYLYFIYSLGLALPILALTVRRLHDTDRSGFWLLLYIIPFGGIVLLIFLILSGTAGRNSYGPDPWDDEDEDEDDYDYEYSEEESYKDDYAYRADNQRQKRPYRPQEQNRQTTAPKADDTFDLNQSFKDTPTPPQKNSTDSPFGGNSRTAAEYKSPFSSDPNQKDDFGKFGLVDEDDENPKKR